MPQRTTEDIFDEIKELLGAMEITAPVARKVSRVYEYFPGHRVTIQNYAWIMGANFTVQLQPNYYIQPWRFECDFYLRDTAVDYDKTLREAFAWCDQVTATFTARENQQLSGKGDTVRIVPDGDVLRRFDNNGTEFLGIHIALEVSVRKQLGT